MYLRILWHERVVCDSAISHPEGVSPGWRLLLSLFTNIPNPYNGYLYDGLRSCGEHVRTTYGGDPQSKGRPWDIAPSPDELISKGLISDFRAIQETRGSTIVLSGGYLDAKQILRRVAAPRIGETVWFWGERLVPRKVLEPYRRWYFRRFDGVFAVGTWACAGYRAVSRKDGPIHVLPYTTTARRRARVPAASPLFGFAGSLIARKGLDLFIDGMAAVATRSRPTLEVVGSGPERQVLEARARGAGIHVRWLGEMSSADLDECRARWWAQVVPSRYDGWGVVVSEAMASGVPALVSPFVGAGIDLVRPRYNGMRVDAPSQWPAVIQRYCDAAVTENEGARARVVGEELSAEKAAPWLLDVLRSGRAGPPRSFVAEGWLRALDRCPA